MPLYEYACDDCGHSFEVIQKFSDAPIGTCPKCGGAVRKLQSAPAFQFKGSGWYITDYARKGDGGKEGAKEGSKEGSQEGAAAEGGDVGKERSRDRGQEGDKGRAAGAEAGQGRKQTPAATADKPSSSDTNAAKASGGTTPAPAAPKTP
jgi:putative FmdB family regulatory protein